MSGYSPISRLGIPSLDDAFGVLVEQHRIDSSIDPQASGRAARPPVIEIAGTSPCSGKTQLLYHIAATSLDGSRIGIATERGGTVVWIDTDNNFDILRLRSMLRNRTELDHSELKPSEVQTLGREPEDDTVFCLQHLFVFQPQSSGALLSTLRSLPDRFLQRNPHFSGGRCLKLIILSNLSSFLWQDRQTSDSQSRTPGRSENDSFYLERYRDIVGALRTLQATFECTIVAGNWVFSPSQRLSSGVATKPHMPAIWTNFCTIRLLVWKKSVPKLDLGISAQEALTKAARRGERTEVSVHSMSVNTWGLDHVDHEVRNIAMALQRRGTINFHVNDNGLEFIGDNVKEEENEPF